MTTPQDILEPQPEIVTEQSNFVFVVPEEMGKAIWESLGKNIIQGAYATGPDQLVFELPNGEMYVDGKRIEFKSWTAHTTFFPTDEGLLCPLPDEELLLEVDLQTRPDMALAFGQMRQRNALARFIAPVQAPIEPTQSAENFPIHTGQECDVWIRSVGDGKSEKNWRNEEQRGVRLWEKPGATHRVELDRRQDEEEGDGLSFADLVNLTKSQSIDSMFALSYVCGVLSPPGEEKRRLVGGWIDLNDVMKYVGWLAEKPDAARKEELRAKVWEFLRHGARARVVGKRSVPYEDRDTREVISTIIDSTPWKITDTQRPEGEPDGVPLRAYVVISQQWTPLLTSPHLSQYMPLGELLASIPPGKPGGDWARTIGFSLTHFWRMKPRETKARTFCPTRRQLLLTYTPKNAPEDVLASKDPKHAVKYYREALQHLADGGFIAREGDAAQNVTATSMLQPHGRQGWRDKWLDDSSGVFPGQGWQSGLEERAAALPPLKRKDLKAKPKRRTKKPV